MMIKDALQFLNERFRSDGFVQLAETDTEFVCFNSQTGEERRIDKSAKPVAMIATDLPSVVRMISTLRDECTVAVLVQPDKIFVQLDQSMPIPADFVSMQLSPHPALNSIVQSNRMDQKTFCRWLRRSFYDATLSKEDLRECCQSVKFETSDNAESSVKHGDDRMSRSVVRSVRGITDIPDSVVISFDPYPALRQELNCQPVSVACDLQVNTEDATFELTAFPGEIDRVRKEAVDAVMAWLTANIDDEKVHVYAGSKA